jgi:hypothetical protein
MKKLLILMTVLCVTVPALGQVNFNVANNAGTITISYNVASGANPTGIALRLNVDAVQGSNDVTSTGTSGAVINAPGDVSGLSDEFKVYLDAAWDEEVNGDGYTLYEGGPLAKWITVPGVDKGPAVLPDSKVAICMGHVRASEVDPDYSGPASDTLLSIALTGTGTTYVVLDVDDGSPLGPEYGRGGVTGSQLVTNLPLEVEVSLLETCYEGQSDEAEWIAMGRPPCWCFPNQCYGDADGIKNDAGKAGSFWVAGPDLAILDAGWLIPYGGDPVAQPWICADFNHLLDSAGKAGDFRVAGPDLTILSDWWLIDPVPGDCMQ